MSQTGQNRTSKSNFIKNFEDWFKIKPEIDGVKYTPPKFSNAQIWYCFTGENIGVEISGKGVEYLRPYLILQTLDRYSFIGLPLSTQIKVGDRYFPISFRSINQVICLHQPRHFDYRRLKYQIGEIQSSFVKIILKKPKNTPLN